MTEIYIKKEETLINKNKRRYFGEFLNDKRKNMINFTTLHFVRLKRIEFI